MPEAILLIGFPGSGKSRWRADYLARAARPTAVVSSDDLLLARAAAEGISYAQAWRRFGGRADAEARAAFRAAVEAGVDVIVDRTNLRARSRRRFLAHVPRSVIGGWQTRALVFVTPFNVLRARLDARAATDGHPVAWGLVVGMLKTYQPPLSGEFDTVDYLTV